MPAVFLRLLNKTKRLLELLFYYPFDTAVLSLQPRAHGRRDVAIVHVELLGDYILWLPYGQLLARHFDRNGLDVLLIINEQLIPLAKENFPAASIIGISRTRFLRDLRYRAKMLSHFAVLSPTQTLHDTSPRETRIGDAIVRALAAPAVGFDATYPDQAFIDPSLHRKLYSQLIRETKGTHQNFRHLALLEAIGAPTCELAPAENLTGSLESPIDNPYIAIVPGSSRQFRCWPAKRFATLAERILDTRPEWQVVVLGTHAETELGEQIVRVLGSQRATNMAGKTDLEALINWIQHARLLIGNDSGAGHIAAACGTSSLIVVGGGHYGRCFPYDPGEALVRKLPTTVTQRMDCFGCDWRCRYPIVSGQPVPCIDHITVDAAWEETKPLLETIRQESS